MPASAHAFKKYNKLQSLRTTSAAKNLLAPFKKYNKLQSLRTVRQSIHHAVPFKKYNKLQSLRTQSMFRKFYPSSKNTTNYNP